MTKSLAYDALMWLQEVANLPPGESARAIQLAQNALQVGLEQHNALLIAKAKFTLARLSHHTNDSLDSVALITDAMREFARLGAKSDFTDAAFFSAKFALKLGYLRSSTTLIAAALNSSPTSREARSRADFFLSHVMLHMGRYDEARDLLERQATARSDEVRPSASAFVSLALVQVIFAMYAADVTSYVTIFRRPAALRTRDWHLEKAQVALSQASSLPMSDKARARCWLIYVFIYTLQGDMRAADVALERAEALGVALPQNWWRRHVAHAKGVCARLSGVAHLSVEQHNIAVAESIKSNDLQLLRVSYMELALAYESLNEFGRAFESMKQYAALDAQLASRSSHQSLELTWLDAIREVTPESAGDRSKEPLLLQNAIRLIAAMNGRIPIATLVKELGVSRRKLEQIFREWRGTTPAGYMRNFLLDTAATRLKTEPTRISVLAYELGFSSPSVFSRLFSRRFGMSPKIFAERNASAPLA